MRTPTLQIATHGRFTGKRDRGKYMGENTSIFIDSFIPAILIMYGFQFSKAPPGFGSRKGFVTKYSKKDERHWKSAHAFVGKLCIKYGLALLLICLFKNLALDLKDNVTPAIIYYVLEGAAIVSLIPLTNNKVKKEFHDL